MIEGILLSLLGREALDAVKKFCRKRFGHRDDEEKKHRRDAEDTKKEIIRLGEKLEKASNR